MPAIAYHFLSEYLYVPSVGLTVRHYPERQVVFLGRGSTFLPRLNSSRWQA